MAQTLSAIGRAALIAREGIKLKAYRDSVGVPTIGIGHTAGVQMGQTITAVQADAFFAEDVEEHIEPIRQRVKVALTQNEFDALASFVFNIGDGPKGFRRSAVLRLLNAGDKPGAAAAMMNWTTPEEITSRREAERDQFLTPYSVALPKARSDDRNRVKPIAAVPAPPPRTGGEAPALVTPSAPPAHGLFGKLGALLGRKDVPVIKATKGDPLVYSVQEQLQAKGYYLTGQLDGLDGRKTRDAVASIRKDNGMGDGGMDEDFVRRLPSFPQKPVAVERAAAGVAKAAAARPEVFSAPTNLTVGGLTIGGLSGILGGAGETISKFKDTADKAGSTFDTVQGIISPVASVVAWCLAHPFVVFGCIGAWFFVKGLMRVLDLWLRFRQDRI